MAKRQRWFLISKSSRLTDICPVLFFDLPEMQESAGWNLADKASLHLFKIHLEFQLIHFCSVILILH